MSVHYSASLDRLSRVPGVRGAAVIDARAGVAVLADGEAGVALTALAAALYRRSARATDGAGVGPLSTMQLDAEHGHLVVSGAGDLLVAAIADPGAQLGLIRLEARRAAEALR